MNWLAFALLGAVAAALTSLFAKLGVSQLPSNFAVLIRTAVVLLLVAVLVLARSETVPLTQLRGRDWAALVLSGVATGLSWLAFFRALQMAPVSWVVPVDKLSVALTVVLAAVFLKEPVTARVAVGACLIVAGAICVAWR